jgi:SAM-dependent methyltransferase
MAESFGIDPERYDRARPRYPDALVQRIVAGRTGSETLDVGCGTGIEARQFQAAGCVVLGVEPDARMAEFARARGLEVDVAGFERDGRPLHDVLHHTRGHRREDRRLRSLVDWPRDRRAPLRRSGATVSRGRMNEVQHEGSNSDDG